MSIATNRAGPSNATPIETQFVREIQRRFRTLRGLVRRTVGYENDALGLGPNARDRTTLGNAEPRERFDFETRAGITRAFIRWLQQAIQDEILEPVGIDEVKNGQHWTAAYIRSAVISGVNQSTGLLFQQGAGVENIPNAEILQRPIFAKTLQDLHQRTYENLESITSDMVPTVRDTLTEGYAKGWHPRKMADELTDEIRDIQRTRAETLARSETIHAHSESSLRNYERADVNVVSHRWSAADDTRTCAFCRRLDGAALTIDEIRSEIVEFRGQVYRLQPPSHPNGRCVLMPLVGADAPDETLDERVPGTVI